jgi:hypothetical protein
MYGESGYAVTSRGLPLKADALGFCNYWTTPRLYGVREINRFLARAERQGVVRRGLRVSH